MAHRQPLKLLGDEALPAPPASGSASDADDAEAPVWYDSHYRGDAGACGGAAQRGGRRTWPALRAAGPGSWKAPRQESRSSPTRCARNCCAMRARCTVMVLLVWLGVRWSLRPLERLRRSVAQRSVHDLQPLDTRGVPQGGGAAGRRRQPAPGRLPRSCWRLSRSSSPMPRISCAHRWPSC